MRDRNQERVRVKGFEDPLVVKDGFPQGVTQAK